MFVDASSAYSPADITHVVEVVHRGLEKVTRFSVRKTFLIVIANLGLVKLSSRNFSLSSVTNLKRRKTCPLPHSSACRALPPTNIMYSH